MLKETALRTKSNAVLEHSITYYTHPAAITKHTLHLVLFPWPPYPHSDRDTAQRPCDRHCVQHESISHVQVWLSHLISLGLNSFIYKMEIILHGGWGDFPCGSAGKESAYNAGDLSSIPGLGRSPGEGNGYPLLDSGLEKSMNYIVHGVTKSRT